VVPGDVAILLGSGVAARAGLDPVGVTLVVVGGVLAGATFSFWVGRRGGRPLVARWGHRFGVNEAKIRSVEDYFTSHGAKTVFIASFVAGLKNMVPAIAGASGMTFPRFLAYNAVGSTLRSAGLVALGYVFGANLERALKVIRSVDGWVFAFLGAVIVFALTAHLLKKRRLAKEGGRN
jgi:membrane protein DedA with SNARE-associated domain